VRLLLALDAAVQRRAALGLARFAARTGDAQLGDRALGMVLDRVSDRDGDRPAARPRPSSEATDEQRAVAAALVGLDGIDWTGFRIPYGPLARRRWAGVLPPGTIDPLLATLTTPEAFAALDPVSRLVVFLERHQYNLGAIAGGEIAEHVAAAMAADPAGARAAVDTAVRTYLEVDGRASAIYLAAVLGTRPDEAPPAEALRLVNSYIVEESLASLARFPAAALESLYEQLLGPTLREALGRDGWTIPAYSLAEGVAPLLSICPSPVWARRLLLLGWAGGQPAAVREAVGQWSADKPELAPVLAEYDAIDQEMSSWPEAREALRAFA
jgi:hypothetical protein